MLLEASAGTGKTWTIGALVTRYVAEGVARLEEMLVVTFGRAASQELRERVRAQLVEAERALSDDPADRAPVTSSSLVDLLLAYDDERAPARPTAGWSTRWSASTRRPSPPPTSSARWCSTRSAWPATPTRAPGWSRTSTTWSRRSVDDLYLRAFALDEDGPAFTYDEALKIARRVVDDPQARLEPAAEDRVDAGRPPGRLRPRRARPRWTGASGGSGSCPTTTCSASSPTRWSAEESPAAERMRQRWQIVLVDEFQDTDPVQWQVLDRAFTGHATMVLIGDPKQAIYAFRGGDVTTYLKAAGHRRRPSRRSSVNWRSDAAAAVVPAGAARAAPRSATSGSWSATSRRTTPRAGWSAPGNAVPGAGGAARGRRRSDRAC